MLKNIGYLYFIFLHDKIVRIRSFTVCALQMQVHQTTSTKITHTAVKEAIVVNAMSMYYDVNDHARSHLDGCVS